MKDKDRCNEDSTEVPLRTDSEDKDSKEAEDLTSTTDPQTHTRTNGPMVLRESSASLVSSSSAVAVSSPYTPKSTNCRKMTNAVAVQDDTALRIRGRSSQRADEGAANTTGARTGSASTPAATTSTPKLSKLIQSIPRDAYESILGISSSSNQLEISWGLLLLPITATETTEAAKHTSSSLFAVNPQELTFYYLMETRYAAVHSMESIRAHCAKKMEHIQDEHVHILPPIFTTTTKLSLKQMLEAPYPWIVTRHGNRLQLTVVDDRVASLLVTSSSPSTMNAQPTSNMAKHSKRKKKKKRKQQLQQQATASADALSKPTLAARTTPTVQPPQQDSNGASVSSRSTDHDDAKSTDSNPPPPPPQVPPSMPPHLDTHDDEDQWEQVQTRRKKTPKANKQQAPLRKQPNSTETKTTTATKPPPSKQNTQQQQQRDKDQNTAPTYQETVLSKSTNTTEVVVVKSPLKSSSQHQDPLQHQQVAKSSPLPPLPRLLSPENASSATSSVASSLEPDGGNHHHHHHIPTNDTTKEGYHLLDVCDRLSRDMSLFMSRRAVALNIRRRERSMLISKLQDTINTIWNKQRVQLYGSCATELDLPASDVDVVVMTTRHESDDPKDYHTSNNGDRIRRLADELEKESWAVQVRAIPTASVPVIKILADPSKLKGMPYQQHLAEQAAAVAGKSNASPSTNASKTEEFQQSSLLPWRGSDVMNGLLSLDITFEGREHGGLWSTEFSAVVVSQICAQTGLHPDATPFVQTLMVLKELLSQRKLNEPYSGGLSSYALLLLLLALVNERQVIREEINRFEHQKRAMAGGNSISPNRAPPNTSAMKPPTLTYRGCGFTPSKYHAPNLQTDAKAWGESSTLEFPTASSSLLHKQKIVSNDIFYPNNAPVRPISSWAAIAKQPQDSDGKRLQTGETRVLLEEAAPALIKDSSAKWKSFADAVSSSLAAQPKEGSTATPRKKPDTSKKPPVTVTDALPNIKQKTGSSGIPPRHRIGDDEKSLSAIGGQASSRNQSVQASLTAGNASFVSAETSVECVTPTPTPCYPHGYNDIVEVLCSGEPTSGKLLMHFLLYYGQHFDAQSTAIDVAGKHDRDFDQKAPFSYFSPYLPRTSHGVIDPVTGMLTVDPIVVFEPFEGAQDRNVARRCFAWNSVKWIFAQSYSTLASAVERSKTPPATPGGTAAVDENMNNSNEDDPSSSSLLRCLLSF